MTEYKVWSAIINWIIQNEGHVFGACPPGGSVYGYSRCCLVDVDLNKRDEPDIMFAIEHTIFLVECKPRLSGLLSTSLKPSEESDVDKLLRICDNWMSGKYREQLRANFQINQDDYRLQPTLGYAQGAREPKWWDARFLRLVLSSDGQVHKIIEP